MLRAFHWTLDRVERIGGATLAFVGTGFAVVAFSLTGAIVCWVLAALLGARTLARRSERGRAIEEDRPVLSRFQATDQPYQAARPHAAALVKDDQRSSRTIRSVLRSAVSWTERQADMVTGVDAEESVLSKAEIRRRMHLWQLVTEGESFQRVLLSLQDQRLTEGSQDDPVGNLLAGSVPKDLAARIEAWHKQVWPALKASASDEGCALELSHQLPKWPTAKWTFGLIPTKTASEVIARDLELLKQFPHSPPPPRSRAT
jgi:hypothetical protein